MDLATPIEQVAKIGPVYQKRLKKIGVQTIRDLLFHFPYRYDDFSKITPISQTKIGGSYCIQGEILENKAPKAWKKRFGLTEAVVKDDSGAVKVLWFGQSYLIDTLKKGDFLCLAGRITEGKKGVYMASPIQEKMYDQNLSNLIHTGRIVPVYPETERLSSRWLRYIIKPLLVYFKNQIPEILPKEILAEQKLPAVSRAIWQAHFPDSLKEAALAKERFSFEELFLIQLLVLKERLRLS